MKKLLLPALLLASPLTQAASTQKPNIVVILADDLGYGDVRCNNPERGKIPTRHIDRLAAGGMCFTDGHSSSGVCSPSRYTLLTGRYHWRSKLQSGIVGQFAAPLITPERFTIANLAKSHGYRTAAIGATLNPTLEQEGVTAKRDGYSADLVSEAAMEWLRHRDHKNPSPSASTSANPTPPTCPSAPRIGTASKTSKSACHSPSIRTPTWRG